MYGDNKGGTYPLPTNPGSAGSAKEGGGVRAVASGGGGGHLEPQSANEASKVLEQGLAGPE